MGKKMRVAGIAIYRGRQIITLDEYEMDYWDLHILPNDLFILEDLRS